MQTSVLSTEDGVAIDACTTWGDVGTGISCGGATGIIIEGG